MKEEFCQRSSDENDKIEHIIHMYVYAYITIIFQDWFQGINIGQTQCSSSHLIQAVKRISIWQIEGILPKGPYPPCLRMADSALLAGYPRNMHTITRWWSPRTHTEKVNDELNSVRFWRRPVAPRPVTLRSGLQLQKCVGPAGRQLLYLLCWAKWPAIV